MWTWPIVQVAFLFLLCGADQLASVKSIESLRNRAYELKIPVLPPSSSDILLNSVCQRFGRACPIEYESWLLQQLKLDSTLAASRDTEIAGELHSERRHEELLSERLAQLQAEGVHLVSTLELLRITRDAYGCNNASFRMPEGVNIQIASVLTSAVSIESMEVIFLLLNKIISGRDFTVELLFSTLAHTFASCLLATLLVTWILVGGRIPRYYLLLLVDSDVPVVRRYRVAVTFVKFSAVSAVNRLRLVATVVFIAVSTYTVASLPAAFRDSKFRSLLSFVVPSHYLDCAITCFAITLVFVPVAAMFRELQHAWNELIKFEAKECDERSQALLAH